mmetsp:Transcript_15901/g.46390  ORF Transcript_15901/g.46390 Transcript_15901/m.46390 type:complete len:337 (-) Transcript_15901:426-1436(-)
MPLNSASPASARLRLPCPLRGRPWSLSTRTVPRMWIPCAAPSPGACTPKVTCARWRTRPGRMPLSFHPCSSRATARAPSRALASVFGTWTAPGPAAPAERRTRTLWLWVRASRAWRAARRARASSTETRGGWARPCHGRGRGRLQRRPSSPAQTSSPPLPRAARMTRDVTRAGGRGRDNTVRAAIITTPAAPGRARGGGAAAAAHASATAHATRPWRWPSTAKTATPTPSRPWASAPPPRPRPSLPTPLLRTRCGSRRGPSTSGAGRTSGSPRRWRRTATRPACTASRPCGAAAPRPQSGGSAATDAPLASPTRRAPPTAWTCATSGAGAAPSAGT